MLAKEQIDSEVREKLVIDKDLMPNYSGNNKIEDIKEQLTFEIVVDVLKSVGYEVVGNRFKLRDNENTSSATINYKSLLIKDFGSDYYGDLFDILVEHQEMKFGEAMRYIRNFI